MLEMEQSKFNFATNFLSRINAWLLIASDEAFSLNAKRWFHALLVVYREMADDMKGDTFDLFEAKRIELNESVMQLKDINVIPPLLYQKIHLFEIDLRKEIKRMGYKTKYIDNPRFAQ